MNSENKVDHCNDNRSDMESPPPCLHDVEAGLSLATLQAPTLPSSTGLGTNIAELWYGDGDELTKDGDCAEIFQNVEEHDDQSCPQQASTVSLTSSLRAAAPLPLRSSCRQSVPGAFRMGMGGIATPAREAEEFSVSISGDETAESVGFRTHNAHEVLIEATLVSDQQSIVTTEDEGRQTHQPGFVQFSSEATNQREVALVEAKPLNRCYVMLGDWKAICSIILVIVAIAAVAAVIERNRPSASTSNTLTEQAFGDAQGTFAFTPANSSSAPTATFPKTQPPSSILALSSVETLSIKESEAPFSSPSESPSEGLGSNSTATSFINTTAPTNTELPLPAYTLEALKNPDSPQSLALDWLFQDPYYNFYSTSKLLQRYALVTFYFALNGHMWPNNEDWLSYEVDECLWYSDIKPQEAVCSSSLSQYQALSVHSNEYALAGSLPREIFLLTSLSALALYTHNITGALPETIGELSNMRDLALRDNALTGSLPPSLGGLRQMTSLRMERNGFRGIIPPSGLGGMTLLTQLHLNDNQLTWILPSEVGLLAELEDLSLHTNILSGSVPSQLGLLTRLQKLYLSNNRFRGSIPLDLLTGASASLQILDLGNNQMTGSLPLSLSLLTNAHTVDLYGNRFSGHLPSELGLMSNVSILLLESNNFTGPIVSELGTLTNLSALFMHGNNFSGSVPQELCALKGSEKELVISVDCDKVSCACGCECSQESATLLSRDVHALHP
jgi:Leucine-rich repeat (LRR) protein